VVPLAEVERVLLFTDGIFEVENTEQEAFGEQRLVEVVDGLADKGIEELLDGVLERVRAFAGSGKFDDDVCLVGMEVVR
jgi:serine phosphatase RsbU (regulator of sigma subunit)